MDMQLMTHICPACGGTYDFAEVQYFPPAGTSERGLRRYSAYFGLEARPFITLGEGQTPLLEDKIGERTVFHKMESLNPTGSYKDRGSVVLVNYLRTLKHQQVVEDSSGNAGASLAGYSARAGLSARIFVPENTSGAKKEQIEAYGAQLVRVPGPRANAAAAVIGAASRGVIYASHAFLPFGMLGISTIAFEIFEALGNIEMEVIAPIGHGNLLLGIIRGFESLKNAGLISRIPLFTGVQAEACAPAYHQYYQTAQPELGSTIAEGVRVTTPVRADVLIRKIRLYNGMITTVAESELASAYRDLAGRGIHVEPTSALTWASCKKSSGKNLPAVLIQTGAGLKYHQ
jgi:threonine synthase